MIRVQRDLRSGKKGNAPAYLLPAERGSKVVANNNVRVGDLHINVRVAGLHNSARATGFRSGLAKVVILVEDLRVVRGQLIGVKVVEPAYRAMVITEIQDVEQEKIK